MRSRALDFARACCIAKRLFAELFARRTAETSLSEHMSQASRVLIVTVEGRIYALPFSCLVETMRPLPIESIPGAPSFVRGVAIIRGIPTPVVDLGSILGVQGRPVGERFVTVRADGRQVALIVDAVVGIRELSELTTKQELPRLLNGASDDIVETIATLDEKFLTVLRSGWKLPADVWEAVATQEAMP
jgi:purine-binding chemotaxis protein CheW